MDWIRQLRRGVRRRRLELGISQAEVARRARLEQRQVSLLENGGPGADVRLTTLARILDALDLEFDLRVRPRRATGRREVDIGRYPALRLLAWNRATRRIPEEETFALYERNWRHIGSLEPREAAFVRKLARRYGSGVLNV